MLEGSSITPDDFKAAWEFFDPEGRGSLSAEDVRERLSIFYRNVTPKEVKFLMNNQPQISKQELESIVKDTRLVSFDPLKEAFKLYDPLSTGFIDNSQLGKFFTAMGYGVISDDDIAAIGKIMKQTFPIFQ